MKFLFLLLVILPLSSLAAAPLFQKGTETFLIVDSKSKPASLRILKDSLLKQSLAVAVNSAYKLNGSESAVKPYVDVRLEKLFMKPIKADSQRVSLSLLISGRNFDLDVALPKNDLAKGKWIEVKVPAETDDVGIFSVKSRGQFRLQYLAQQDVLLIEQAQAHLQISNPMSGEEEELVKFTGKGLRQ